MAEIIADRVLEVTTSTGTGNVTVTGALPSFRTFGGVCATNDTFYASIVAVDGTGKPTGDWEVGYYRYLGSNVIERTAVSSSSNNNQLVNFGSGPKHIGMVVPAYQFGQFQRTSTTAPGGGGNTGGGNTGGGGTTTPPAPVMPYGRDASLYGALTFRDDFDGTTWDSAKWSKGMFYSTPDKNNIAVANGNLYIWVEQPYTNYSSDPEYFNEPNASITTDGKFYQKYGYFECRAKLPIGAGVWPAFWLYNHDTGGIRPEIDIFETYCGGNEANGGQDWATADYKPQRYAPTVHPKIEGNPPIASQNSAVAFGYQDLTQWHRYGLHWDANKIIFFFDGQQVGPQINTSDMDLRMYMLLDVWLGSASGFPSTNTSITPTGQSNSLVVDYVYAWALADGSTRVEGTMPAPTNTGTTPDPSTGTVTPTGVSASLYSAIRFSDEFNGTALDLSKWNKQIWYGEDNAVQNFAVSGGCLNVYPQADGTGVFHERWFSTFEKFSMQYGFVEIEAQLPIGVGPALVFGLASHESGFNDIEILHAWTGADPDWATSAKHPNNYAAGYYADDSVGLFSRVMTDTVAAVDLSAAPHKFGVHWDATGIQFYFDGTALGTRQTVAVPGQHYLLIGFTFGDISGTASATNNSITPQGISNSLKINYVRAWGLA